MIDHVYLIPLVPMIVSVIVLLARGSSSRYVRESGYWRDWHRAR